MPSNERRFNMKKEGKIQFPKPKRQKSEDKKETERIEKLKKP
jgi:hypothetical protein